ncbi:MAG: site-specific integrase [Proteobacteria bacterium]|nr:site-specific integrase [Pseudomonadota bacterium]
MAYKNTGQKFLVNKKRWPGVYYYESQDRRHRGKPDLCYYINYRLDGKLSWEKIGWISEGYTPPIASDLRSKRLRAARHTGEAKTQKEIRKEQEVTNQTLDQIAVEYFKHRGGSKAGGKIDSGRYYNHVSPSLGKRAVGSLAPLDMERIKKGMKGMSAASIWGALEIIRRVVNFGAKNGMCAPLGFVIEMPKRDNEVVEYLEPDQLEMLNSVLDEWPSPDVTRMLRLAMYTGMRRGEIFKLEETDLDFRQGLITLRKPKGGKTLSIPMSPLAESVLRDQIEWRNREFAESPYVFPGTKGGKRTGCTAVKRIKKAANLPESFRIFHGLRHHFAVTLANSGEFSLDMIGQLLTHKSGEMTKRYAQFLPGTLKDASKRASELLAGGKARGVLKKKVQG